MISSSNLEKLVPTYYTKQITAALDASRRRKLLGFISGETGRGKTLTCRHYAAAHPETVLVELPGAVNPAELIRIIAVAVLGTDRGSQRSNKIELHNYLSTHDRMIVIDEANQLLHSANSRTIVKNLEFVRRNLYDLTGTAVVLVFTGFALGDLRQGSLSGYLEQIRGRIGYPLQIKGLLKNGEVKPIVQAFVPDADQQLIDVADAIARPGDGKLRTLVKYLALACEAAAKKGIPVTATMLKKFHERYEDGGKAPNDNALETERED